MSCHMEVIFPYPIGETGVEKSHCTIGQARYGEK